MPKNKIGGKKHKGKKNTVKESKELIIPEKNELIGQVTAVKGSGRFDIRCIDGVNRIGIVRGTMRKKVWINHLDLVLIEPWTFESEANKCSILHKYEDNEKNKLQKGGHLPKEFKLEEDNMNLDEDNYFSYDISDSDNEGDENPTVSDEKVNEKDTSSDEDIDLDDI